MTSYFAHGMNAFLLTVLLISWLRTAALRVGLVDRPDHRKVHEGAVPLCGGLAIFAAFLVANAGLPEAERIPLSAFAGLALVAVTGLIDDRFGLPARPRLLIHLMAALVMVGLGGHAAIRIADGLPPEWQALALGAAPVVAVLFLVGTINAINMIDGVDGLAGGVLVGVFFWLAVIAGFSGHEAVAVETVLLASAIAGFLLFNMRHPWRARAAVFLGDAGSMTLGAAAAFFIILLSSGPAGLPFIALLWLVVVPVTDTLILIVRRLSAGRSPFSADRWHLHHLVLERGHSPSSAARLITAASFVCGGVAYLGLRFEVPGPWMVAGLALPVGLHIAFVLRSLEAVPERQPAAAAPPVRPALGAIRPPLTPAGGGRP